MSPWDCTCFRTAFQPDWRARLAVMAGTASLHSLSCAFQCWRFKWGFQSIMAKSAQVLSWIQALLYDIPVTNTARTPKHPHYPSVLIPNSFRGKLELLMLPRGVQISIVTSCTPPQKESSHESKEDSLCCILTHYLPSKRHFRSTLTRWQVCCHPDSPERSEGWWSSQHGHQ